MVPLSSIHALFLVLLMSLPARLFPAPSTPLLHGIVTGDSSAYFDVAKPAESEVEWIIFEVADESVGTWMDAGQVKPSNYKSPGKHTNGYIGGLVNGRSYAFRVRFQAPDGSYSEWAEASGVIPRAHPQRAVPFIEGRWWRIGENAPDVSPYNTARHNACDFSIWQDANGHWHLVSCIRETAYPGRTRLFHHWESLHITDQDWALDKRVFWTSGLSGSPDAFGRRLEDTPHIIEGRMQAPHCFRENGRYYFFYNNNGCFLLSSPDGDEDTFDYQPGHDGKLPLFTMDRDVSIFDNRARDGLWYAYYTANTAKIDGVQGVNARSAQNLLGPWSDILACDVDGFFESPFVIHRHGAYYIFAPCTVWASDDPLDFSGPALTTLVDEAGEQRAAIEIVQDAHGQDYIAGYGNGIWVARLGWRLPGPPASPTLSLHAQGNQDTLSFTTQKDWQYRIFRHLPEAGGPWPDNSSLFVLADPPANPVPGHWEPLGSIIVGTGEPMEVSFTRPANSAIYILAAVTATGQPLSYD